MLLQNNFRWFPVYFSSRIEISMNPLQKRGNELELFTGLKKLLLRGERLIKLNRKLNSVDGEIPRIFAARKFSYQHAHSGYTGGISN